jgi:hypothetical protein
VVVGHREVNATSSSVSSENRPSYLAHAGHSGHALVALMQEKSFEEITVQDLLERAGVGRSTFYVHYRDKDDLFLSDVEDFFEKVSTVLK